MKKVLYREKSRFIADKMSLKGRLEFCMSWTLVMELFSKFTKICEQFTILFV